MNSSQYYDLASLAEASYTVFDSQDIDKIRNGNFTDEDLEKALQAKAKNGSFSETQAAEFVEKWSVAAHQANTASGFSATLFQNVDGSYVYAIENGPSTR